MHTTGEETRVERPSLTLERPSLHPLDIPPLPYPPYHLSPVTYQAELDDSYAIDGEPPTMYNSVDLDHLTNDHPSYFDAPKPSESLLNALSSLKRKRATPVSRSPVKKAKPIDENQGDEVSLHLLRRSLRICNRDRLF